jgi:hypothetical protein
MLRDRLLHFTKGGTQYRPVNLEKYMRAEDNAILARPIKTFHGEEGFKTPKSAPFPVSRQRLAELKANELVVEVVGDEKMAPSVSHKSAATPRNKSKNATD